MSPVILRLRCIFFFSGWTIHRGLSVAQMTLGIISVLYGQNAKQGILFGSLYCSCMIQILR